MMNRKNKGGLLWELLCFLAIIGMSFGALVPFPDEVRKGDETYRHSYWRFSEYSSDHWEERDLSIPVNRYGKRKDAWSDAD